MTGRVIFYDAFNPFLVRQNAQTLVITFAMDMVVSLLGATPIFDTQWAFLAIFLFVYYLAVNVVQGVLAFPLIWPDPDGHARMGDWPLAFIVAITFTCVWPLHSISVWVRDVIAPVQQ